MNINVFNEVKAAVDSCFANCDESFSGKAQAINATLGMFDKWRDAWARDYQAALESGPDLSPKEFDASRNCLNSL